MPFADRVLETTSTGGLGSFALAGAMTGHRSFASAFSDGAEVPYCVEDGVNWEVITGIFTYPATLSRVTTAASSNSGSPVNFASGLKRIFATFPAYMIDPDVTMAAFSDLRTPSQKALKGYLDSRLNGLNWKTPGARAATTAALPANTYSNGASGVGATLTATSNAALTAQDGVTLAVGETLLVKNEAAPANNGLYVLTQLGSGSAPYILTRRTDADAPAELVNATAWVSEGSTLADSQWTCTANATITVGTTALAFAQNGASSFTGGTLSSALNEAPPVTIASSATPAIGAAAGNSILLTGTTTVTGFDTIAFGAMRRVRFGGVLTLTYNATSLILPGAANITTAADDVAEFLSLGSGNWFCTSYSPKSGRSLVASPGGLATAGINAQTGTSYTFVAADAGKLVTHSNASATADTLPQAGSTGFPNGWSTAVRNLNNGVVTITPATSTIDGAATLVLRRGDSAVITSDGTNYSVLIWRAASRGLFTLTDATTIAVDMGAYDNFVVTLGGNRTMGLPTNMTDGQTGSFIILQPGTGGPYTLAYNAAFKFPGGSAPTLSTAANARDRLYYTCYGSVLDCVLTKAFS